MGIGVGSEERRALDGEAQRLGEKGGRGTRHSNFLSAFRNSKNCLVPTQRGWEKGERWGREMARPEAGAKGNLGEIVSPLLFNVNLCI